MIEFEDAMEILDEDIILNDINNRAVDTIAKYLNRKNILILKLDLDY